MSHPANHSRPPELQNLRVSGGCRGVSWRANGEANSYHLLCGCGDRWLAHILINGELCDAQQTRMMERIVTALGGPAGKPPHAERPCPSASTHHKRNPHEQAAQ